MYQKTTVLAGSLLEPDFVQQLKLSLAALNVQFNATFTPQDKLTRIAGYLALPVASSTSDRIDLFEDEKQGVTWATVKGDNFERVASIVTQLAKFLPIFTVQELAQEAAEDPGSGASLVALAMSLNGDESPSLMPLFSRALGSNDVELRMNTIKALTLLAGDKSAAILRDHTASEADAGLSEAIKEALSQIKTKKR